MVMLRAAIPMIGFGFMDNFVLIIAGDYIDSTIGVSLGISTMCAAALGNIVSDLCGVPAGSYIEVSSITGNTTYCMYAWLIDDSACSCCDWLDAN